VDREGKKRTDMEIDGKESNLKRGRGITDVYYF